jgi:hypothetical protein
MSTKYAKDKHQYSKNEKLMYKAHHHPEKIDKKPVKSGNYDFHLYDKQDECTISPLTTSNGHGHISTNNCISSDETC